MLLQKRKDFDNELNISAHEKFLISYKNCLFYTNISNVKIFNFFRDNVSLLISRHSDHGTNLEQDIFKTAPKELDQILNFHLNMSFESLKYMFWNTLLPMHSNFLFMNKKYWRVF